MGDLTKRLERQFQKLPRAILRSPLHGIMSRHTLLLTFTGRKSGKVYATPVNYVRKDDEVLLTTTHPWWKNLQDEVPVTLHIRGRKHDGTAKVETEKEAVISAVDTILAEQPGYGKWIGVRRGPDGWADRRQAALAFDGGLVAIRIRLNDVM